jgi:hypothetical protein
MVSTATDIPVPLAVAAREVAGQGPAPPGHPARGVAGGAGGRGERPVLGVERL